MSKPIISVENLGKSYLIGHESACREKYHSLRETLARNVKNFVRKTLDMAHGRQILQGDEIEEFWALKDVSFNVQPAEVVGIIGRNGAGKSTLLKVLSRITEPTKGRVTLRGRVASLLEVGTGFHSELTGRENIYLNGAILGMTRTEINKKFDEIVEFAEVEKFLDTPVKRYSSGMYVRLAFGVAAHLEPEILIVDEVLAVGDAKFQKKCLGKMSQVADGGRTVLFVSHNMAAVERLCSRTIVLDSGAVAFDGKTRDAINDYLSQLSGGNTELPEPATRAGNGMARITAVHCPHIVNYGEKLEISLDVDVYQDLRQPDVRLSIYSGNGACVSQFGSSYLQTPFPNLKGNARITLVIPSLPLNVGHYTVNLSISEPDITSPIIVDRIESAASFQVAIADPYGTGKHPHFGTTIIPHEWLLQEKASVRSTQ